MDKQTSYSDKETITQKDEFTNQEIIEYLQIAYKVLSSAKSSIDLNRLNKIILALEKDTTRAYEIKRKSHIVSASSIFKILYNKQSGNVINNEEEQQFQDYLKRNSALQMSIDHDYKALYTLLQKQRSSLSMSDLKMLYYVIFGQDTKIKKRDEILDQIISFISQNVYFDNMDEKYGKKS